MSVYVGGHMRVSRREEPRRGIIRYAVVSAAILIAAFYLFTSSKAISLAYTTLRQAMWTTTETVVTEPEKPSLVVIARRPASPPAGVRTPILPAALP